DKAEGDRKPGKDRDEEKGVKGKKKPEKPPEVKIDFEDIDQRILALPLRSRGYMGLVSRKPGVLFVAEAPLVAVTPQVLREMRGPRLTLHKFDLEKRKE